MDYEWAPLGGSWPWGDKAAQEAILFAIHPGVWKKAPSFIYNPMRGRFHGRCAFGIDGPVAPEGRVWIWEGWAHEAPQAPKTIVVRRIPPGSFVLNCDLSIEAGKLKMTYITLAGTTWRTDSVSPDTDLSMGRLSTSATIAAMNSRKIQSHHQAVHVVLQGFTHIVSPSTLLWTRAAARKASQIRLRKKTSVANKRLLKRLHALKQGAVGVARAIEL